MKKTIYDLELHEIICTLDGSIIRVPGGWIYNRTVFVPFDAEFEKSNISNKVRPQRD